MAVNNYSDRQNNEIDELFSAIIGLSENSSKRDKAIENAAKIIKDATDLMSKATHSLENSMTFATKEMNKSFNKHSSSFAKAQNDAILKLNAEKSELADTIHELDKALEDLNVTEKSGKYVDLATKNAIQQKRDIADYHLKQLNSIKAEQAYKIQVANELKKKSLGILSNLANNVVQIFTQAMSNAYNSLSSSWETNFSTITSYQNFSKNEVNAMIDSVQQMIKDNRLDGTISAKDYMDEYSKILQGGIRDSANSKLATKMAYYSVMSKEGGISINFSDTDIQKHIVKIADEYGEDAAESIMESFMTNSKAVADVVGNNFGFVNGQIDVMAQSFYRLYEVTDMTPEGADKAIESMTALNGVLGKTGLDVSKIYEEILSYAESGFSSSGAGTLLKYAKNYTAEEMKTAIKEGNIGQVITDTVGGIYDQFGMSKNSAEFKKAINEALGTNYTVEEIDSLLNTYKDKDAFTSAFREAQAAAAGATEEAYYENAKRFHTQQEDFNNRMEGWMTDLVQFAKSNGIFVELISNSLVGVLAGLKIFGKGSVTEVGKDIFNTVKNWFGKGGAKAASAGKAVTYSADDVAKAFGTTTDDIASALGKSATYSADDIAKYMGSSTDDVLKLFGSTGDDALKAVGAGAKGASWLGKAGKFAGKVAPFVSLAFMGWDAYSGYKEDGAAGAIRGAITGSGKAAESGWDVAGGTVTGAINGATIGSFFGPLGTAIGAAVGGLAGLAVGLSDLNNASIQYKLSMEKLSNATDSIAKLNDKNKSALESAVNAEEALTIIKNKNNYSVEDQNEALAKLKKLYPDYMSNIDSVTELDEEYIKILEYKIEKEKRDILDTGLNDLGENSSGIDSNSLSNAKTVLDEKTADYDNAVKEHTKKKNIVDIFKGIKDQLSNKDNYTYDGDSYQLDFNKMITNTKDSLGLTDAQMQEFFNSTEYQMYISTNQAIFDRFGSIESASNSLSNSINVDGLSKELDDFAQRVQDTKDAKDDAEAEIVSAYEAQLSGIKTAVLGLITLGTSDYSKLQTKGAKTGWIKTVKSYNNALHSLLDSGLDRATKENIKNELSKIPNWSEDYLPSNLYKTANKEYSLTYGPDFKLDENALGSDFVPALAVGLNYVPYDNFYARLHKGERIQTAAEANLDRVRSEVDSGAMMSTLSDALVSQTDTIIDILEKIYKSISGRPSGLTGEFDTSLKSIASSI